MNGKVVVEIWEAQMTMCSLYILGGEILEAPMMAFNLQDSNDDDAQLRSLVMVFKALAMAFETLMACVAYFFKW